MATKLSKAPRVAPRAETAQDILALTIGANRIASNTPDANGYELRNEVLERARKHRIAYENGKTKEAYSAELLFADAVRKGNYRRTLARKIDKEAGAARPVAVCAHHVVASQDTRANHSRTRIFACGIGINDVDNDVYLPRFKNVAVPSLPNAPLHGPIYAERYHVAVFARLLQAPADDQVATRVAMKDMKADLIDGVFPF